MLETGPVRRGYKSAHPSLRVVVKRFPIIENIHHDDARKSDRSIYDISAQLRGENAFVPGMYAVMVGVWPHLNEELVHPRRPVGVRGEQRPSHPVRQEVVRRAL